MCALPLPAGLDHGRQAPPDGAREARFRERLDGLERRLCRLWQETDDSVPEVGEPQRPRTQRANARECRRFIDRLVERIEDYPEDEGERQAWRAELKREVQRLGEERLGWPPGYRELLVAEEFFEATVQFSRRARQFDQAIGVADLSQALRNVWIANSLQMLLDLPVALTPTIFAYSMLYPYTDNYLDDPEIPIDAKQALNRRLRFRLEGSDVEPLDDRQGAIFDLVAMIEDDFPRLRFADVFSSLQAIHRGQIWSLEQQRDGGDLSRADLLRISVSKGGASVLADGYLSAGTLAESEEEFCFGYGAFLQLLDDLQDVRHDLEAGHRTLFSVAADQPLDRLTSRLHRFMHAVVQGSERFSDTRYANCRDLILRNCVFLLVGAVAESPEFFSPRFRRHLQRRWPLRLRAIRKLRQRASQGLRLAAEGLCQRQKVDSLLQLL